MIKISKVVKKVVILEPVDNKPKPAPKPTPWWQNQPSVSKFKAPKTGRDFTGMRRGSR